jgi:RimJ/RimL family protein N-acetyltransferase
VFCCAPLLNRILLSSQDCATITRYKTRYSLSKGPIHRHEFARGWNAAQRTITAPSSWLLKSAVIQASGIDSLNRIAEMGICIDKLERGKGLGREAIVLLEKYLLKVFNVRKIWLRVRSSNMPAVELYRSSGFREVGTLRKHHYADGRFHDVVIMEKLLTKTKEARQ